MTRLPLTFPPLVEMAERAAIEHSAAFAAACTHGGAAGWDSIDEHSRRVRAAAFASLLSDLTRPESQAIWLPWLAGRVGVPAPVVGAPRWYRLHRTMDGAVVYVLESWTVDGVRIERRIQFGGSIDAGDPVRYYAPTLDNPDAPDAPIRALVLAVLTVGGVA